MRALLIVNPRATSTTRLRRDVIVGALASAVKLDVSETRYRGHATALAVSARSEGYDLVLTLGGDGTVNETVNGLLHGLTAPAADELPAFAALPGGNANVFTGALGLPRDPVDAAGQILHAISANRSRTIGLGRAEDRFFTFNSGLGLDAEVVRAVQGLRAHGRPVTPALYMRLTMRQFHRQTDRRHPALTIEADDRPAIGPVFLGIVSNTTPWTYLGHRALQTNPAAGFGTGLDIFAMRRLPTAGTYFAVAQMLRPRTAPPAGRSVLTLHDCERVTLRSERLIAFQVDGEYLGEREAVTFWSVPKALRVVA